MGAYYVFLFLAISKTMVICDIDGGRNDIVLRFPKTDLHDLPKL